MPERFKRLFEPGKIGTLRVKNRIIMAPTGTRLAGPDCMVTDRMIGYYEERARGGMGMVVVEAAYPTSFPLALRPGLWDDKFIPGLKRVAEAIHAGGAAAAIQILPHGGRRDKYHPISASLKVNEITGRQTEPLDIAGIEQVIRQTGEGARRAREAGFDAIMIHGAHGYLVQDFTSPLTNKRNDAYGGDFDRRLRFALEIVKAVRAKTGPGYPVMYRLFGDERVPDGLHLEDTIKIAKILQDLGIDSIDITSGSMGADEWGSPSSYMPAATNADLAAAMKANLRIPVSLAGRIKDADVAESVLEAGKADFVDMARALIADPFLPQKIREGRLEDIRCCISCLKCNEAISHEEPVHCSVNPAVGREREFQFTPAQKPRKVVVVGGGPAGMEAALIAAQRGHRVTLFEAGPSLGGQLDIGSKPPAKEELEILSRYMVRQIAAAGVNVKLNTKAGQANIAAEKPDAVIVASGAVPATPRIKGLDQVRKVYYDEVLSGAKLGQNVVVIGGGLIGCEVALFLRQQGKDVTILEVLDGLATDAYYRIKKLVNQKIVEYGVKTLTSVKDEEIEAAGVRLKDASGQEVFVPADSFVVSCGSLPNVFPTEELPGKVGQLFRIGDCVKPRSVLEATREAADAALQVS